MAAAHSKSPRPEGKASGFPKGADGKGQAAQSQARSAAGRAEPQADSRQGNSPPLRSPASPQAGTRGPRFGTRLADALEDLWITLWAWVPTPLGMALRLLVWRWLFARCGSVRFATGLTLGGCRHMALGKGVRLGRGSFVTAHKGSLTLGDHVALSPCVHVGADGGTIVIGAHAAIGPGTVIRAANHCFSRQDMPIMHQGHEYGEIIIDDDVWIGANCVITPNVHIGQGAVVGAGAVVTHDVEPFSIVAGVPARPIGRRGELRPKFRPQDMDNGQE